MISNVQNDTKQGVEDVEGSLHGAADVIKPELNMYVFILYPRAEMYPGCVACCPLVSHGEYADEQTDGRMQTVTLRFLPDAASDIGRLMDNVNK